MVAIDCFPASYSLRTPAGAGQERCDGRTRTEQQQDLADGRVVILDTSTLVPGRYRMDLTIIASDGTRCAHEMQPIEAVDGLLARPS